MKLDISKLMPTPGAPTLAWLIARRVTGKIDLDCTIMITGKKGTGKSYFSLSLAYEIAKCIAIIKHKKELKALSGEDREIKMKEYVSKYFSMEHVRSVDKNGTLEMFSGDIIKTENSILICDDVSIAANSRNSMTSNNKALSQIMTVSRIYRNVVILNTVYSSLVDKTARGFSDILIELVGIDKVNQRSVAKVYLFSINQINSKEYRKFYTWHGARIIYWFSYLPPQWLRDQYRQLRKEKTDQLVDDFKQDLDDRNEKGFKRQNKAENIINTYKAEVIERRNNGESIKSLSRIAPELTEYWINKIISLDKREKNKEAVDV